MPLGATPPWLQDDDDNEDHGNYAIEKKDVIGPSHEAFKSHGELKQCFSLFRLITLR